MHLAKPQPPLHPNPDRDLEVGRRRTLQFILQLDEKAYEAPKACLLFITRDFPNEFVVDLQQQSRSRSTCDCTASQGHCHG